MTAALTKRLRTARVLALSAGLCLFACLTQELVDKGARQRWLSSQGPVVPHDSFPSDCRLCHIGSDWTTIRSDFVFDHEQEAGHVLRGAHAEARCLRCHNDRGPVASFAARGCAGCHTDVHAGELGRDCEQCHDEQAWRVVGIAAQHSRTRFPLVGSHASVACWRCHEGARAGDFSGLSIECLACHQSDLERTREPDHLSLGWVDSCERCHKPYGWRGAGFAHPAFPLRGDHGSLDCSDCHGGGTSFASFSCIDCHAHRATEMAEEHEDVGGYTWESMACFACHPNGEE